MTIDEERQGSALILTLTGKLDGATCPPLEQRFTELLAGDVAKLVIGLAQLDYISSAGLRVLLVAAKKMKSKGGSVALYALQPQIFDVFKISGFGAIFPIHPDRAAALA